MNNSLIAIVGAVAMVIGFASGMHYKSFEIDDMNARMKESFKYWYQKVGSTTLWPGSNGEMISYNLRTFDGGEHWYQVAYDDDWKMHIVGDAEQLYPGIVDAANVVEVFASDTLKHERPW